MDQLRALGMQQFEQAAVAWLNRALTADPSFQTEDGCVPDSAAVQQLLAVPLEPTPAGLALARKALTAWAQDFPSRKAVLALLPVSE